MARCSPSPILVTDAGGGLSIYTYNKSITRVSVDAIVSSANENLCHQGGLAEAVSKAAGEKLKKECADFIKTYGPLNVTQNCTTTAGRLTCKYVIHAVGPRWHDYNANDKEQCLKDLSDTVKNVILAADAEYCSTVALPAISSGIFGVPKPLCAAMYIRGIVESCECWLECVEEVHLIDINDDILAEIKKAADLYKRDQTLVEPSKALQNYRSGTPQRSDHCYQRRANKITQSAKVQDKSGHSVQSPYFVKADETSSKSWQSWHKLPVSRRKSTDDDMYEFCLLDRTFNVKIYTGSITRTETLDAIISSADVGLRGLGPLSEAIRKNGGREYENNFIEMQKRYGHCATEGSIFSCKAGASIPVKYVVHVVMNRLSDTSQDTLEYYQKRLLGAMYQSNAWQMSCIALPLICGGSVVKDTRGLEKLCMALFCAINEFCKKGAIGRNLEEVHLVNKSADVTRALKDCFAQNSVPADFRSPGRSSDGDCTQDVEESALWFGMGDLEKSQSYHSSVRMPRLKRQASTKEESDNLLFDKIIHDTKARGAKPKTVSTTESKKKHFNFDKPGKTDFGTENIYHVDYGNTNVDYGFESFEEKNSQIHKSRRQNKSRNQNRPTVNSMAKQAVYNEVDSPEERMSSEIISRRQDKRETPNFDISSTKNIRYSKNIENASLVRLQPNNFTTEQGLRDFQEVFDNVKTRELPADDLLHLQDLSLLDNDNVNRASSEHTDKENSSKNKVNSKGEIEESSVAMAESTRLCAAQVVVPNNSLVCSLCSMRSTSSELEHLPCGHSFCTFPCFLPMQSNRVCCVCEPVCKVKKS